MRQAVDRLATWVHRRPLWVLAPVGISFVVLLVAMARERWYPTGDMAQAELHVRGFLRHPPLVGAAARIGPVDAQGSHPGPSLWVILYPTYLLFGRSSFGMMAGMVVLHSAAIVGSVWIALRIGGRSLALLVAAAVAVTVPAAGGHFLVEPWNPWAAVFPFLLFVLLVAGVAAGHRWMFLGAIVVGSHCVQAHIGYVFTVAMLCAFALAVMIWDERRARRTDAATEPEPELDTQPSVPKVLGLSAAAFFLMWLPPLIDQFRRDPGNLTKIWREFMEPHEAPIGWWRAFKAFAGEVNLFGDWASGPGHLPTDQPNWIGFLLIVGLMATGTVLALRGGDRTVIRVQMAVGAAWLVGLASMSRIFGVFYPYVIRWLWMLAILGIVVPLWGIARYLRPRLPESAPRMAALGALAVSVVFSAVATVSFAEETVPSLRDSRLVGGVVDLVHPQLDPDARYLVRWHDPASLGGVGYGVIVELEREGLSVGVDLWGADAALPHRFFPELTVDAVLWVVTGEPAIADFRAREEATELGYYDQRTPAEVAEADRLRAQIEARLIELGKDEMVELLDVQYGMAPFVIGDADVPEDVRVTAGLLNALRLPIAIFSVPPCSPLYEPGSLELVLPGYCLG